MLYHTNPEGWTCPIIELTPRFSAFPVLFFLPTVFLTLAANFSRPTVFLTLATPAPTSLKMDATPMGLCSMCAELDVP